MSGEDLLKAAVSDRDKHPWRYYRLEHADMKRMLDELAEREEAIQRQLNAWRELGEEMGRVLSLLPKEQYEDLFPDWFGPRLFDLQVSR